MKKVKGLFALFLLSCALIAGIATASVVTIRPDGQGRYADWLNVGCDSGSDEWNCVKESPPNNSDYLYASVAGSKESFSFEDSGLSSESIYGIEVFYNAKRYSPAKYYLWPLFRINNTDFTGSSIYLYSTSQNFLLRSQWVEKNPLTRNRWTANDINNLEAGLNLLSYSYAGANVSQMYINIDYDSPGVDSDLNVTSLTFSEYIIPSNQTNQTTLRVSVYATVKNNGLDTADVSTIGFQGLSSNYKPTMMLRAGKIQSFSWTYNCTASHNVMVSTDANGVIAESDEANNIVTKYIDCMI